MKYLHGNRFRICVTVFALLAWASMPSPASSKGASPLNPALPWHGSNAAALSEMIARYGNASPTYKRSSPPVAVFDWDNTVIKNDVGDATFFWMLTHNKIRQPENKDWRRTSPLLTEAAQTALNAACDSQGEPGAPLKTAKHTPESIACADEIVSIYDAGKTHGGAAAWKNGAQSATMEPAYAWAVQLQSGYTPDEIRGFARKAIRFNTYNDVGATQTVGSKVDATAYVRVYDQIRDLIRALHETGFDVWVVSASSQFLVDTFAAQVDVDPSRVIGVRPLLDRENRITPRFEGCGTHADGNQSLITYKQGKRCWINKTIFGVTDPKKMLENKSPTVFVAGDSDTDLFMLKDARVRLVINRNKTELMCNAYAGQGKKSGKDGTWIVNPMFIKPKSQKKDGYACKKYGLPNQKDSVF